MIQGKRIYLRALELEDYKTSINWRKDDDIWGMVGGPKYNVSSEVEKKWVENTIFSKDKIVLAICLCEGDKYIGNIILSDIDWINRSASTSTMIGDKAEWEKGYATEAKMIFLNFVFEERGLNRINSSILDTNRASLKVQEKCGYKLEGTKRQAVYKGGQYIDLHILGLLREEFEPIFKAYKEKYL